jgi:Tfp pilus assembly protein PilN
MRAVRWLTLAVMVVAVAAFARYLLARQESAALRTEITLLQQENQQVARLQAERERLEAAKVSEAEVRRLRTDRAALNRLRNEINTLEENAERMSRAASEVAANEPGLRLNLRLGNDGTLLLEGTPLDLSMVRQRLAGFSRSSERVEVRLGVVPSETPAELIKATADRISKMGRELNVRLMLRVERSER